MGYIGVNALAIVFATAAGLFVGWLSHLVSRPAGKTARPPTTLLVVTVLAEAWLVAILAGALILAPSAGPGPWTMAFASAVVIWIGFVLPTVLVTGLHGGLSPARTIAYVVHWLAVMLAQASVLQAIGLVKPA